jgi:hypothetical protein
MAVINLVPVVPWRQVVMVGLTGVVTAREIIYRRK